MEDFITATMECGSDEHLERIDMLKRAGWSIVNVPYYWWYKRGWLCDEQDSNFCKMANDLEAQIAKQIGLNIPRSTSRREQLQFAGSEM